MSCCNNCRPPCPYVSPYKTLPCNIIIKDYTPCPPKCYQVWVPQKMNIFTQCFIPGHYEYICSEEDSTKVPVSPCPPPLIGGCAGTRYGCCPSDRTTSKVDEQGSNCPAPVLIGGCAGTRYGCCKDGTTSKHDAQGSNCYEKVRCLYTCPTKCHDTCFHYKLRQANL